MRSLRVFVIFCALVLCPLPALAFQSGALEGLYVIGIAIYAIVPTGFLLILSLVLFLLRRLAGKSARARAFRRIFGWCGRVTGWLVPPSFLILAMNIFFEKAANGSPSPHLRDALLVSFVGLAFLALCALLVERLGRRIIANNRESG